MASWFRTDPAFSTQVKKVWTWSELPGRKDAGQSGHDVGIDLVIKTLGGAVQVLPQRQLCKS